MVLSTKTCLGRRGVLAALLAVALIPLPSADAHPPPVRPDTYEYSVTLEDASGQALPTYWDGGERFVLGHYGERYAVRIRNHGPRRVEAVLSIDGRDAVSGRRGDYESQRGYLIEGYGSLLVTGFRRSLDEVATFRFTSPGDSYSSRMGTPENVGVVGVAFFPEKQRPRERPMPLADDERRSPPRKKRSGRTETSRKPAGAASEAPSRSTAPAPTSRGSASSAPRDPYDTYLDEAFEGKRDNLGTSYGEHRNSSAVEVPFERQDRRRPSTIVTLRYDDEEGLASRGIRIEPDPPTHWWRHDRQPQAFPESRFAPPPP